MVCVKMEKEIILTDYLSVYTILTNFIQNSVLFLTDSDKKNFVSIIFAFLFLIGTSLYIVSKVKANENKNLNKFNKLQKGNEFEKRTEYQSRCDNYDYHKILSEFHNVCNNCSNIFSSMKCVQLASNYPELINIKLFSDGVTPFHRICFHGNEPLIELMLAKGADPHLKTIAGENALCMALYYYLYTEAKDFTCLNLLYQKGCYLTCDDEWYGIFLNLSIKSNNKKLSEWLLTHSKSSQAKKPFTRASSAPL